MIINEENLLAMGAVIRSFPHCEGFVLSILPFSGEKSDASEKEFNLYFTPTSIGKPAGYVISERHNSVCGTIIRTIEELMSFIYEIGQRKGSEQKQQQIRDALGI